MSTYHADEGKDSYIAVVIDREALTEVETSHCGKIAFQQITIKLG